MQYVRDFKLFEQFAISEAAGLTIMIKTILSFPGAFNGQIGSKTGRFS
jgi:hypothetical protein